MFLYISAKKETPTAEFTVGVSFLCIFFVSNLLSELSCSVCCICLVIQVVFCVRNIS